MSCIKQHAAVLHGKLQVAVPIIIESLVSAAADNTPKHSGITSVVRMLQSTKAFCCSSSSTLSAHLLTADLVCAGKSKKKNK